MKNLQSSFTAVTIFEFTYNSDDGIAFHAYFKRYKKLFNEKSNDWED